MPFGKGTKNLSCVFGITLQSGGAAGLAVDIALFPLDTIKTRLQSKQGFKAAGGFRGVYSGIGPVVLGSAPGGMNCSMVPLDMLH